ncbi:MAG: uroporphyrinogen-III synthase [Rhodobacteraceae bacterium]|nr:uroporphyrinogen-III synthase [Paracoccaceae bacterium]
MGHRPAILTRPLADAQHMARQLHRLDTALDVHIAPMLTIKIVPHQLKTGTGTPGIILTSANAIRSLDPSIDVSGLTAWCVGPHTAKAARDRGLEVRIARGTAIDLIDLLQTDMREPDLLYIRGTHIATPLTPRLVNAGYTVHEIITYDQVETPIPAPVRALMGTHRCLVSLHSVRTAHIYIRQAKEWQGQGHILLCRSAAIAAAVGPGWITQHVDDDADLLPTLLALARTVP